MYIHTKTIDAVVLCAGFGISGAIEFTELSDAKKQFDVNFFGVVNTVKAVLPYMRKEQRGRIIIISSLAAPAAIPFQAFYSASKAALECGFTYKCLCVLLKLLPVRLSNRIVGLLYT